tara:strand:+ start:6866 stop:7171 length:306 start_codon:yes stop_codon:yes gene_type:complete
MSLPPYAKTTIRLAFGSKRQTGKLAHLLFGFSIEIQRWQALPLLTQSKVWHFLYPKPTSASKYKPFDFLNPECKRSFGVSIFLHLANTAKQHRIGLCISNS